MAFLKRDGSEEGPRRLIHGPVRHPELRDYAPGSELRNRSRAHLTPWEPSWPEDELTRASFRHKLRRHAEDIRDGRSYPFFIFRLSDEALLGGLTLSRVQRGVSHSASLGYWIGAPFVRVQAHLRAGGAKRPASRTMRLRKLCCSRRGLRRKAGPRLTSRSTAPGAIISCSGS